MSETERGGGGGGKKNRVARKQQVGREKILGNKGHGKLLNAWKSTKKAVRDEKGIKETRENRN